MIDSHCHLDFDDFKQDLPDVIKRASEAGVVAMLIPGVKPQQWQRLQEFREHVEQIASHVERDVVIKLAIGVHPYFLEGASSEAFGELKQLAQQDWVRAIGECGIDAVVAGKNETAESSSIYSIESQQAIFEQHIKIANDVAKPLIVHHRKSHHLLMQSFKHVNPKQGGIIHAFSGSIEDANRYIELGFKLGCGGTITYPRANKTRQVFQNIGLEHIVLETDSPDMPLNGFQGSRNEPARVKIVAEQLAALREISVEQVVAQTNENFYSLTM